MSRVLPDEQCVFYGQLCALLSCVLWIYSDNSQTDYSEQWKNYWDNGAPEVAVNCADCLVTFLIWFEWECVGVWQCMEKEQRPLDKKIQVPSLRAGCGTDIKVLRHSSCPPVPLLSWQKSVTISESEMKMCSPHNGQRRFIFHPQRNLVKNAAF